MPKKRYRPEEIISKLREADVLISQGKKVVEVIKALESPTLPITLAAEYGGCLYPRSSASRSWRRRMSGFGRRSRT